MVLPFKALLSLVDGRYVGRANLALLWCCFVSLELTQSGTYVAVMNNYQAAAAAGGFGPPASPHAVGRGFGAGAAAGSPGPALDMYNPAEGYVQAASPQPSGFPAIAVSRAPLNYSPVSVHCRPVSILFNTYLFTTNKLIH